MVREDGYAARMTREQNGTGTMAWLGGLVRQYRAHRKRRRYQAVLERRDDLNDFETQVLLPELRGRLEWWRQLYVSLIAECEKLRADKLWSEPLNALAHPLAPPLTAETYFGQVIPVLRSDFLEPIDGALQLLAEVKDYGSLALALNRVHLVAETITGTEEKFLVLNLRSFVIVRDSASGASALDLPRELTLISLPFKHIVEQLVASARPTAESITLWRDTEQKSRIEFLAHLNARTALTNSAVVLGINLATVVAAVALSAFFLIANDPFQLVLSNRALQQRVTVSDAALAQERSAASKLRGELDVCTSFRKRVDDERQKPAPNPVPGTRP
jgi:hypothetical protein